jgi:kynurenine 3-monooxygenase
MIHDLVDLNAFVSIFASKTSVDMRLPEHKANLAQRSINLAMSSRGITALHAIDPEIAERFLKAVIPMRGRMIHPTEGKPESQLYDLNGQVRPAP